MRTKRADTIIGRGNVDIVVRDARTGRRISARRVKNLTVTAGRNLIRDLLYGDSVAGITHFATGTGSTAATAADTTLATEVFRAAVTSRAKGSGQLTVTYFLGTGSANGSTLREAGLFNASSSGTMYARAVLTDDIAKTSGITVTFSWSLTWTVA